MKKTERVSSRQERKEVPPRYLSIPEVAATLCLSRATIYRLIYHKGLPVSHFGRAARVSVSALEQWLAEQGESA